MDLKVAYNQLLFWINKEQGAWYPPEDLDAIVHAGQLSYAKDCYLRIGTSQRMSDAISPLKIKDPFTTTAFGGLVTPAIYQNLIDIICFRGTKPVKCPVLNDDEITDRRNSQVIKMSLDDPFAEEDEDCNFQLYPIDTHVGILSFYRTPPPPKFVYTVSGGRVIDYNQADSDQLVWKDDEVQSVLIWTLRSIGINIGEPDIQQFANQVNQQDLLSTIKI